MVFDPARKFISATCLSVSLMIAPSILLGTSPVAAATNEWSIENPVPGHPVPFPPHYYYGTYGGEIISISTEFDSVSKRLKFVTVLGPTSFGTPSSYKVVINNGPMPWSVGNAAIIYFDGNDAANPTLTAYGYNAGHALYDVSWRDGDAVAVGDQAPDLICTSVNTTDCGNWVNNLSVTDVTGGRRFEFDIDATEIINHVPAYTVPGSSWYGTGFDQGIGLWFHPATNRQYTYASNGYISGVTSEGQVGYFDAQYLVANTRPECVVSAESLTLRPNETAQVILSGFDADGPLPQSQILLIADPLPATWVNCVFESVVNPGIGLKVGRYTCDITAPVVTQNQNYSLTLSVTDKVSQKIQCQSNILIKNTAPTCGLFLSQNNPPPLACEGAITTVDIMSSVPPDADADPVIADYAISCSTGSASLQIQSPNQLVASLTGPGFGTLTTCTVEGTVSDGYTSSTCSIPLSVPGCELDCSDTPLGDLVVDQCGVCGGNNACFDCAGVPFGTTSLDRCNICGGDGSSCLNCTDQSNFTTQLALDTAAHSMSRLNKVALRTLKRALGGTRAAKRFEARKNAQVQVEYLKAWRAIWSITANVTTCANGNFCQTVSVAGADNVSQYDAAISRMEEIAVEVAARLRKANKKRAASNLLKDVRALDSQIATDQASLVLQSSVCS